MSNFDQDRIINSAFNESDIESWMLSDAQAQAELTKMQAVKGALHSLSDIPECQLSSERLKLAIETSSTTSRAPSYGWLKWLAPGLVAASAGIFLLNSGVLSPSIRPASKNANENIAARPLTIDENTVVASDTSSAIKESSADLLLNAPPLEDALSPPSTKSVSETRPQKRRVKKSNKSPVSKAPTSTPSTKVVASNLATTMAFFIANTSGDQAARAAAPAVSADRADLPEDSNIVVVESEIQPNTNAARAIERQNDDVVFGG